MATCSATRTAKSIVGVFLVALVVAACGGGGGSSTTTTVPTTTTTLNLQSIAIQAPEGQVSLTLDGKLPPGWPANFPVPQGATPAGSGTVGGTTKTFMVGVYDFAASPQDAYTFYKNGTGGITAESSSSVGAGTTFVGTVKLGGTYKGSVTVISLNGQTVIVVVLEGGGSTSTTRGRTSTTSGRSTTTTARSTTTTR